MGRQTRALEAVNWRRCPQCFDRLDRVTLKNARYTDEVAGLIMAWHDRIGNEMLLDFKRTKPKPTE